jgi:hypothetical protein
MTDAREEGLSLELARAIDAARILVSDVSSNMDCATSLASSIIHALDLDRNLDYGRAHARALELADDLLRPLDNARKLASTLVKSCPFDVVCDLAQLVERGLTQSSMSASQIVGKLRNAEVDLDMTRDLARELVCELDLVRAKQLRKIIGSLGNLEVSNPLTGQLRPAISARRLVDVGVRLLPVACRARYSEEFGAELLFLAGEGVSWRRQMTYAARLLSRNWSGL